MDGDELVPRLKGIQTVGKLHLIQLQGKRRAFHRDREQGGAHHPPSLRLLRADELILIRICLIPDERNQHRPGLDLPLDGEAILRERNMYCMGVHIRGVGEGR